MTVQARGYAEIPKRIKPYNFLNIAFVHPTERPVDEERIVLVAPFEREPDRWLEQDWFNRCGGRRYRITTEPSGGRVREGVVTVTTCRDILTGGWPTEVVLRGMQEAICTQAKGATTEGALVS